MTRDSIKGDRRLQRRYPVELDLEYRVSHGGKVVAMGAGRTTNMSSGGLLFRTSDDAPNGRSVELSIRWPAVLGNEPFLELCVFGRIVRNDSNGVAVLMSRYSFQKLTNARGAFEEIFTNAVIQ
ncbi:MAG: PilZ domain-containing protein [Bryobacteraceae bacterium]|jgi:hypothetical protein